MKIVSRLSTLAILLASCGVANFAGAQGMGAGGGGGTTGATGFGTTGTTTGATGFGTTGTTGTNTSTSRTGTNTGTNTGTSTGTSSATNTSKTLNGAQTFVQPGSTTGTGASAGGRTGAGGMGGGGMGGVMTGGMAGVVSPFGQNPFGTGTGSSTTTPGVRARLRSAVVVPSRSRVTTQSTIQQNVTTNIAQPRFRGVDATSNGATTVIRGTVTSESDRRMAELMMRLEPGVSRVENRITVSQ